VNYFGLGDFDMIQCPDCGLISIDPIPEESIIAEGCTRLYLHQQASEDRDSILRGFAKSYRKGAKFARKYLKENTPLNILEVGAGDGYFSAGIKAELPGSKITLVDIVEDLSKYYLEHHDCNSIVGEFNSNLFSNSKFDLIIFRDLLEHVRDPFLFLKEASLASEDKGRVFFITPNGREDFWLINQRYMKTGGRSLILLNHFHYFLPQTLQAMLAGSGFSMIESFKFGLKQHRKGLGHKEMNSFSEERIPEKVGSPTPVSHLWKHNPETIKKGLLSNLKPFSKMYSFFIDKEKEKVPFHSSRGHEFFVFAEKRIE
jgi:2-polyprenyl-3-methyl-5-hydroxy-6-metoxy-1,4-benzoquinol methylase